MQRGRPTQGWSANTAAGLQQLAQQVKSVLEVFYGRKHWVSEQHLQDAFYKNIPTIYDIKMALATQLWRFEHRLHNFKHNGKIRQVHQWRRKSFRKTNQQASHL